MRLAEARKVDRYIAGEAVNLVYAIDTHAPLTTGTFIRPDGSIESTLYGEEFVPLRGRLPIHAELDSRWAEEPPPNGEHDPADPEEEEDPGLAGGGTDGDKPEVVVD